MVKEIIKRNGSKVAFNADKIRTAIKKANDAVSSETMTSKALDALTASVLNSLPEKEIPSVEKIQDLVEEKLIKADYAQTAKAYILYRAEHTKIRQAEGDLMNIYRQLTFQDAKDADIKRENANIDAETAKGTMLKYGSAGSLYPYRIHY